MSIQILLGDCRLRMKELADASVDSVVCDPPYHLTAMTKPRPDLERKAGKDKTRLEQKAGRNNPFAARQAKWDERSNCGKKAGKLEGVNAGQYKRLATGFMGQEWDGGGIAQDPAMWAEVLRVLRPGGFLAAFGGTRTFHRMAVAIEDAGFEIRDCIFWTYSTGFPKSLNVSKNIVRCECDENVHDLSKNLGAGDTIPSDPQQDLRTSLRGEGDFPESEGTAFETEPQADGSLRGLRDAGDKIAVLHPEGAEAGLLEAMQRGVSRAGVGETRLQGRAGSAEETRFADGEESSLEGRGDLLPTEGELHRPEICQGARVGEANGPQGRLHNGAPPSHGADVRVSPDPNRSGQSQGPQSEEQRAEQSGALSDERGSQEGGAWPLCRGCGKPIVPDGLGTALKPAVEPICLARKPLMGSVASNVLAHGTGALNIDATRIATDWENDASKRGFGHGFNNEGYDVPATVPLGYDGKERVGWTPQEKGRWPANLCHDGSDEVLAGFPETTSGSGEKHPSEKSTFMQSTNRAAYAGTATGGDSGSAARFFYCAKATSEERGEANNHPTVKPIALMRWLCRLVTPPGGTILDPFMGSGSTLIAADAEQFNAIGCELSPEYAAIAERRIRDAAGMFADVKVAA